MVEGGHPAGEPCPGPGPVGLAPPSPLSSTFTTKKNPLPDDPGVEATRAKRMVDPGTERGEDREGLRRS